MKRLVSVDCTFKTDGTVRIRRLKIAQSWLTVEPGRQWADADGRHALVMIPGGAVHHLLLRGDSLRWELVIDPTGPQVV